MLITLENLEISGNLLIIEKSGKVGEFKIYQVLFLKWRNLKSIVLLVLGMLGYMSSRVVFALLDCLRSSHDAAVQFDSRPGLKFLVQKVLRFDVAANLYRQAGISRTVYSHVLLELCVRMDDLGVHKIRQVLAGDALTPTTSDLSPSSTDNMVSCHSHIIVKVKG